MTELKRVRSRLLFITGFVPENKLDVTATYNMTRRDFMDRNSDMEVESADGSRLLINKDMIVAIREIKVIEQVVEVIKDPKVTIQ